MSIFFSFCLVPLLLQVWDFTTTKELFELPNVSAAPSALAFIQNSSCLLAIDNSGTVVVWNVAPTTTSPLECSTTNLVMEQRFAVQWDQDGGLLTSQDARTRHLICVRNFEDPNHEKVTVEALDFIIECVALSPDGTQIAVGSEEGHLQVWLRATEKPCTPSCCVTKYVANNAAIKCLKYLNGKTLAAGLSNGEIWVRHWLLLFFSSLVRVL